MSLQLIRQMNWKRGRIEKSSIASHLYHQCIRILCQWIYNGNTMRDYPLNEGFQQRKLPRDAGEWLASSIKISCWLILEGIGEISKFSERQIKKDVCSVTISVSDWAVMEEPASKSSFTLEKLKTLWHLSQWPLQHAFGVEYTENDMSSEPQ